MKKERLAMLMMVLAIGLFAVTSPLYAQGGQWGNGHGNFGAGGNGPGEFIDENGDGYNDLAPDEDGDGIPNYADEDYVRPEGGQGNGPGNFVDEDGDGYNDNAPDEDGDGIPNYADEDFVPPRDGERRGHGGRRPGFGEGQGPGFGECLPDPVARKRIKAKLSSTK